MLSEERVKICPRCKTEQPRSNFHKCKRDGVKGYCKKCASELNKLYIEGNPDRYEKRKKQSKVYKDNLSPEKKEVEKMRRRSRKRGVPLEVILEEERIISLAESQNKKYCYECKNILDKSCFTKLKCSKDGLNTKCSKCLKKRSIGYYFDNAEKMNKYGIEYKNKNKERLRVATREWYKDKIENDPVFRFRLNLRHRLKSFLSRRKLNCKIERDDIEMFGCSPAELKLHLENLFVEGMSWDNYGFRGWHIDHIIPLCSANTFEEAIKLNHYKNLQPLWAVDNLKKGKKIKK
jgi:hypothetical protein